MHQRGLNMKHMKISPTNLIPTLQKHITSKHSNIMNMVVMYIFSPLSDGSSNAVIFEEE